LPSRRFIAAVIAIGGMQLLATMDSTVAIVALPKIQNDLSLSDAGRSWVITAYVLTFGGLMLLGGRLGDTIGRKRTFIVGVTLFTISSVLCAVAWDEATMVIARLLQGRDGRVRRDDRNWLGDGSGSRRGADRGVVAAGVHGERADRAGDDLPGPHRAARDQ
jgi:MFS family permease